MDIHAYEVLPSQFRKAFEEVNGELPESEFIRNIWMDIAVKWFAGWCLAVEHASELRPETPPLPEPEPVKLRHFMLTVGGEGSFIARETSAFGGPVHAPVVMQSDSMREYVSSLEDYRPEKNVFEQSPPFPVPPPMPAPRQGHAPAAPVTAAEAAAASVQKPASARIAVIIPASYEHGVNGEVWLISVNGDELRKVSRYNTAKGAKLHAEEMGYVVTGYEYHMTRDQIRYWQENPTTTYLCKNDATPPGVAYTE